MRDAKEDLEVCEKATPGPWQAEWFYPKPFSRPDAIFIAMARDALPYWLGRAQAAEETLSKIRALIPGDSDLLTEDLNVALLVEQVERLTKENQEMRKEINNFLTFGQGGAGFNESQLINELAKIEAQAATMREALEQAKICIRPPYIGPLAGISLTDDVAKKVDEALSTTAGEVTMGRVKRLESIIERFIDKLYVAYCPASFGLDESLGLYCSEEIKNCKRCWMESYMKTVFKDDALKRLENTAVTTASREELLDRIKKLEAVAEAAKRLFDPTYITPDTKCNTSECIATWNEPCPGELHCPEIYILKQALAALDGDGK